MDGHDLVELRHGTRGSDETRAKAVEVFHLGNKESGLDPPQADPQHADRRPGALPAARHRRLPRPRAGRRPERPAPKHTMWKKGTRLTKDPSGTPILASEVTLGSVFHVIPDGLNDLEDRLEQKAKAAVLLMRLKPEDLHVSKGRESWNYKGIVAYSKICTHVGCPVALYEQQTHHLLCPCHQSQFDITHEARGHLRPGQASAAAAADHHRFRGLPRRAERLPRARRPEFLGAGTLTVETTAPAAAPGDQRG